jgi:hypothetical protein
MPNQIRDGKGGGVLAGVNSEHRLLVSSVSRSKEHHANIEHGEAFTMLVNPTPTGAGDCFFYFKNTSEQTYIFEGFGMWVASNEVVYGYFNQTGTPAGGTDVVPAQLNAGSARTLASTVKSGNDITGLSGGTLIGRYHVPANNATNVINFEADLVIPPNKVFTAYVQTGGIELDGYMVGWVEREEA